MTPFHPCLCKARLHSHPNPKSNPDLSPNPQPSSLAVGYGDLYPTTAWGQAIAVILSYAGIVGIALPVAVVVKQFNMEYDRAMEEMREEQRMLVETYGGACCSIARHLHFKPLGHNQEVYSSTASSASDSRPYPSRADSDPSLCGRCSLTLSGNPETVLSLSSGHAQGAEQSTRCARWSSGSSSRSSSGWR